MSKKILCVPFDPVHDVGIKIIKSELDKNGHQTELLSPDLSPEAIVKIAAKGDYDFILVSRTLGYGVAEMLARFIDMLRPDGVVISSTQRLVPMSVSSGGFEYPSNEEIEASLRSRTDRIVHVDALDIANQLGNARLANTVVLGALSNHLALDSSVWLATIKRRVPTRYTELNRRAFVQGQQTAS